MSEKKEILDEVSSPQSSNSLIQAEDQGSFNYKDPNHITPYTQQQPENNDFINEPFQEHDLPEESGEVPIASYPIDPKTGMSFSQELFENIFFPADPLLTPTYDAALDSWVYPVLNKDQQTEEEEEDGWVIIASQEGNEKEHDIDDYDYDEDLDKRIQFIFDKRHNFKNQEQVVAQQSKPGSSQEEEEDKEVEEQIEEEVSLEDVDFSEKYMNIPEDPARRRMDKDAEMSDVVDSVIKYWPENETEEHVPTVENRMHQCPSIESAFREHGGPVVQLYLYPGNKIISRECRLDTHILQLKVALGRYVRVPHTNLDIRRNKNLIPDDKTLADLGGKPGKKLKFTVEINKRTPGDFEIKILPKDRTITKVQPEIYRRVKVEKEDGTTQIVSVTISFPTEKKPMLGGYVDIWSKKRFHHAETSMEVDTKERRSSQNDVAVQAYGCKVSDIQTMSHKSQQMEKKGYYISEDNDLVRPTKPYTSYDDVMKKRHYAATVIQKYWRRLLAARERLRREEGLIARVKWAEQVRKGRIEERKEIMRQEIERQKNPKHLLDLELLYRAINIWRKEQESWLDKNRWATERKAAIATLTDIETDLLLDLERVKNKINVQQRENRAQLVFETMGAPKRWLSEKTKHFISSDNANKVHVRQLQAIYSQLQKPSPQTPEGIQQRCDLLGKLNSLTTTVDTKMSQMLKELVTRELNFLRMPKCSAALLAGVRRRISSTFYFLCQDPDFNPESKKIQKVPYDSDKLRKDMVQCHGCRKMQHRDDFTITRGTTVTTRCKACMHVYRTAILRVDLNLYRHMLKELRRDEMAAGAVNSVAFLIDAFDLQFLFDQIWHAQSALSGIDNRYLLRLCRWNKNTPWTPWNCVCLTDEEATAHLQLDNLKDAYTDTFFHKVFVKQCTAKTYFEGIAKLMMNLDDRIKDHCKNATSRAKKTAELKMKFIKKIKMVSMLA